MTPELRQIRDEIIDLKPKEADLEMLESLANNILYILSKIQRSSDDEFWAIYKVPVEQATADLLNTVHKEIKWAKEEEDDEQKHWFAKARKHILQDIECLFDTDS